METGAVLLDFYGTLAEAISWGPTFEEVLASHGLADGAAATWTPVEYDGHDHLDHSRSREGYVAWERMRLANLAAEAGAPGAVMEQVVDDLYAATKAYELLVYEEVGDALDGLRRRGLRLAVCSNWDWDLPDVIDRLGLGACFEVVVTSARAGARKPHPRIYAHTLDRLGVEAGHVAFVGDSLGPDVLGPLDHGMRPFHLARGLAEIGGATETEPLPEGAQRIRTLLDLLDLL